MKNLKLFVAPLLGAALLTACGPKPMDSNAFKAKVRENYNEKTIESYVGKSLHVTGSTDSGKEEIFKVTKLNMEAKTPKFEYDPECDYFIGDILSVSFVDGYEAEAEETIKEGGTVKIEYFISGDEYTIDTQVEIENEKGSVKMVFNKDLVISHMEMKSSEENKSYNFKYE